LSSQRSIASLGFVTAITDLIITLIVYLALLDLYELTGDHISSVGAAVAGAETTASQALTERGARGYVEEKAEEP
jgi:hypothetical protein